MSSILLNCNSISATRPVPSSQYGEVLAAIVPAGFRFIWRTRYAMALRAGIIGRQFVEGPFVRIYPQVGPPPQPGELNMWSLPRAQQISEIAATKQERTLIGPHNSPSDIGYSGITPASVAGSVSPLRFDQDIFWEIDANANGSFCLPFPATIKFATPLNGTWMFDAFTVEDDPSKYQSGQSTLYQTRIIAPIESRIFPIPQGAQRFHIEGDVPAELNIYMDDGSSTTRSKYSLLTGGTFQNAFEHHSFCNGMYIECVGSSAGGAVGTALSFEIAVP